LIANSSYNYMWGVGENGECNQKKWFNVKTVQGENGRVPESNVGEVPGKGDSGDFVGD